MRIVVYRILLCVGSFVLTVCIAEFFLRIFRPPQIKFLGSHILLERNITIDNNYDFDSNKIQNHIVIHRNSLGFRGPEPPINFSNRNTIIAIGGSTTECIMITEGRTWTDYVQNSLSKRYPSIWINNAGIDGHSVFGHIKLIDQFVGEIKPSYAMFLIGINDMATDQPNKYDLPNILESAFDDEVYPIKKMFESTMIGSYIRYIFSKKGNHQFTQHHDFIVNFNQNDSNIYTPITDETVNSYANKIIQYKQRLKELILKTVHFGIKPIFITQPAVYGFGKDPPTGVDLSTIIVEDFTEPGVRRRGIDKWKLLELYNTATRETAQELNVPLIDLANEMPKNSAYYYDFIHFTEEGAQKVGEIISKNLLKIL